MQRLSLLLIIWRDCPCRRHISSRRESHRQPPHYSLAKLNGQPHAFPNHQPIAPSARRHCYAKHAQNMSLLPCELAL